MVFMKRLLVDFPLGQNFECFVNAESMKQNTKVMTDSPVLWLKQRRIWYFVPRVTLK